MRAMISTYAKAVCAVAVLAGVGLAGVGLSVSDQWPMFRGDVGLAGIAEGKLGAELELLWTYAAGGAITSSPAGHTAMQ